MILSKNDIKDQIKNSRLIINHEDNCINNSSYKIRIGKLIEPETGKVLEFNDSVPYTLHPSDVILFQSYEIVNLPDSLTASYSALFTTSSNGILLINSSMIEPCYHGRLSGVLLNFSSRDFTFTFRQPIAKINFMTVNGSISNPFIQKTSDSQYIAQITRRASNNYHQSFLNIASIKDQIGNDILKKVKSLLTKSGIMVATLILFATLEPLFHHWIYEKTGVPTVSERVELEVSRNNIIQQQTLQQEQLNQEHVKVQQLENIVDSLKESFKAENHGKE